MLRRLFIVAFPPERSEVGAALVRSSGAALEPPPPDAPTPRAALKREGALLYEIHGEPRSEARA
jgi:hypothetical protein